MDRLDTHLGRSLHVGTRSGPNQLKIWSKNRRRMQITLQLDDLGWKLARLRIRSAIVSITSSDWRSQPAAHANPSPISDDI